MLNSSNASQRAGELQELATSGLLNGSNAVLNSSNASQRAGELQELATGDY
ncbi:hypothetical protein [Flavobacterium davisii]|uniref:Uncharacterized protein n=1 Tax=Flavobacterium columnare TaxID=996 RepID=A0A8G0P4H6_9FLAO|nr:hypothetical protein [Flavobacterium davisii]QYS88036.1 hypothetical protein JJC05_09150 [Flavobacterium davisii]